MGYLVYCLYALIVYVSLWFLRQLHRQRSLPHGPLPYPFVGNLPSIYGETHQKLDRLASQYGPIFTLWFGRAPIVIVSDAQACEEVFMRNGSKFSDRPDFINKQITKYQTRLPYMNYCPVLVKKQTICTAACAVDEVLMDQVLSEIVGKTRALFDSKCSKKSFQPSPALQNVSMQVMSKLIYGTDMDRATFDDFNLPGNPLVFSLINTTNLFRSLRLLRPGPYLSFKEFIKNREQILVQTFCHAMQTSEKEHNDGIESKLTIMRRITDALRGDDDNSDVDTPHDFTDESDLWAQSHLLCSDLFLVSIEKIAATLDWMFLYFVTWPEIQQQLYEKLRSMGLHQKEQVTVSEATGIVFLRAAVYETLRLSSLCPLSTVHQTNEQVTLKGHKLPKGTCVCVNLNAIHHDTKYWDEPYHFNPARFIDEETGALKNIGALKGFYPFGQGVRECFGEELTLKVLTTLMANMLLHFNFDVSPWHLRPTLAGSSRLILVPQSYHITVTKRKNK